MFNAVSFIHLLLYHRPPKTSVWAYRFMIQNSFYKALLSGWACRRYIFLCAASLTPCHLLSLLENCILAGGKSLNCNPSVCFPAVPLSSALGPTSWSLLSTRWTCFLVWMFIRTYVFFLYKDLRDFTRTNWELYLSPSVLLELTTQLNSQVQTFRADQQIFSFPCQGRCIALVHLFYFLFCITSSLPPLL